jgi:hypothetical protein
MTYDAAHGAAAEAVVGKVTLADGNGAMRRSRAAHRSVSGT